MKLTIIGSGTALPQKTRAAPCCLVEHEKQYIVVDMGSGSTRGILVHAGVAVRNISLILITHLHPDHCSDLAPYLFALRAGEMARVEALEILGPEGLESHYRALRNLWGHRVDPLDYELKIREWNGEEYIRGAVRISAALTRHSLPNLAWLVRAPGERGVIVTGDGEPTEELVRMGRSERHVLVAECALAAGEELAGHMNPGQAGELALKCRSEKLVLTHLNPDVHPGTAEMEAKKQFGGEVVAAEDGMVIDV